MPLGRPARRGPPAPALVLLAPALALGPLAACGRTEMLWATSAGDAGSDDSGDASSDDTTGADSTTTVGPDPTVGTVDTGDTTSTTTSPADTGTTGPIPVGCGNGILEDDEECDPGADGIGPTQACVPGCRLNVCGDAMHGPSEQCDDGNDEPTDACSPECTLSTCGDGIVWEGVEDCDDDDGDDDDACHLDCTATRVVDLALGGNHTCALLDNGAVRCWGNGNNGRTGLGSLDNLGDDEAPGSVAAVSLLMPIVGLATGLSHTCVHNEGGQLRCFGRAAEGQLGYGNVDDVGDDELPSDVGYVPLPGAVAALGMRGGSFHGCALMFGGDVRCWGLSTDGRLGVPGLTGSLGDDETIDSVPPVAVGGDVVQLTTGTVHTCARLAAGTVRCWGSNASGQLGYGNTAVIGDDETPAAAGDVPVGGVVQHVTAGFHHTCALLDDGTVRCWGRGNNGRLGYGNTAWIGITQTPAAVGPVDVGGPVLQLEAGNAHTCALLLGGTVRCWGWAGQGQLGYGNLDDIGDDETPAAAGDVPVGGVVVQIAADGNHTCAVLETGGVRCWGNGGDGRLGYGNLDTIGDDETPASVGDVPLLL